MASYRANIHDLEAVHRCSLKARLCQKHDHELRVSDEVGVHHQLYLIQLQFVNAFTHRDRSIIYQDVDLTEFL